MVFGSPYWGVVKKEISSVKTGKKLSEKLLCFVIIHLTELQLSRKKPFAKTVLVEFPKGYLEAHRGVWWKRKYLPLKTGKNLSERLLCVLLIPLTDYSFHFKKPFLKTVLEEFAKWYLEAPRRLWWKRKYPKIKTEKMLSEKLHCVFLIDITEL